MNKEEKAIHGIVSRIIRDGTMDGLIIASLERELEQCLLDLQKKCQKKYLEVHHWMDYQNSVEMARACIRVLQYYTTSRYETELEATDKFSLRVERVCLCCATSPKSCPSYEVKNES